jgi:hypothetical protein
MLRHSRYHFTSESGFSLYAFKVRYHPDQLIYDACQPVGARSECLMSFRKASQSND